MRGRELVTALLLMALAACGNGDSDGEQEAGCTVLGTPGAQLQKPGDGVLVTLEVRFLEVEDSFLRDVGVDIRALGTQSMFTDPAGGSLADTGFGASSNLMGGAAGTTALLPPLLDPKTFIPFAGTGSPQVGDLGVFVGVPGDPGQCVDIAEGDRQPVQGFPSNGSISPLSPNGTIDFSLLGDILTDQQVQVLLDAIANDQNRDLVSAPLIRLYSGQRAVVTNFQFQASANDLAPNAELALGSLLPLIGPIFGGITLDVRPVVSADRSYVRLSLLPTSSAFSAVLSTSVNVGGQPVIVQLPVIQPVPIVTQIMVPDGQTVVLGGILPTGMPAIDKIPYINRLFKNAGIGSTAESLMLMVTPRIIIQEEEE